MKLIRKDKLYKLKRKNKGNQKLEKAVDKLINDIEESNWVSKLEVIDSRPDADKVHSNEFYFFNISMHRTLVLIVFGEEYAEVIWVGNHATYDRMFKGNKTSIETWLRTQGKIK